MKNSTIASFALAALAAATGASPARAETFATCAGFIASVPTTITTQGTWCMDKDLSSALASGALVTVAANNVTIDCNDFKLGGLAAGPATTAIGIHADNRQNITIRNCNLRGFARAIVLEDLDSAGHLVADNRFDGNTAIALQLQGTGHQVRGNRIVDTGGSTVGDVTYGMFLAGDIEVTDNTVDGVTVAAVPSPVGSVGIAMIGSSNAVILGNRVRNVFGGAGMSSYAYGIATASTYTAIERNHVSSGDAFGSVAAIICSGASTVADNRIADFGATAGCDDDGGNIVK